MALNGINSITGIDGKEIKVVDANYDNSKMNNNDFLKVLLADLQWQDPLQVKDISDFIDNTVKLRQMEVLNNFQDTVNLLKDINQTNALLYASNIIDKQVVYEGNQTYVKDGKSKVSFELDQDATNVTVTVLDQNGNVVESQNFKNLQANKSYPFEIDNKKLSDGYYTVYIDAKNGKDSVSSKIFSTGVVSSVEKDQDKIYAIVNNQKIEIDKISQIGG
jgi:flagellar basal-body rod modification protein FlgD